MRHPGVAHPYFFKTALYPIGTPCVQGSVRFWAGGVGGVAQGPVLVVKSKNSVMSGMAASRAVSGGSPKRVSISLSAAVKSMGVCDTKFFFVNGEITNRGTRKPLNVKLSIPEKSFGPRMGAMPSGFTSVMGGT